MSLVFSCRDTNNRKARHVTGDAQPANPQRLLVVEDEPLVRFFMADVLSDHGCEIEEASTLVEGLEKIRNLGHSLVAAILDVGLPDGSGEELVPEIRRAWPALPVLLATGYAELDFAQRFADDPHTHLLPKPFDGHVLISVLRRAGVFLVLRA